MQFKKFSQDPGSKAAICRLGWLLLVLTLGAGCERRQHLVTQHLIEFGTLIEITLITSDLKRAETLLAEVERRLAQYRRQWHAWEESDLTRFNAALQHRAKVSVPASLTQLINLSQTYYLSTDGLFNPALGKLVDALGFHGVPPHPATIASVVPLPTMRDLVVSDGHAHSRNRHLQLDFGGIAKGYAIGLIGNYLDANGIEHYLINAGGDLISAGNRFGQPWRIGVQNPFAPGVIAGIELEGRHSLFTSGNYLRQYRRGGQFRHHIIDPRSGASSRGQSAATVLTVDPVRADVAATALMIDGLANHARLAAALKLEDYLIVSEQREILLSRSLAKKIQIKVSWPTKIIN